MAKKFPLPTRPGFYWAKSREYANCTVGVVSVSRWDKDNLAVWETGSEVENALEAYDWYSGPLMPPQRRNKMVNVVTLPLSDQREGFVVTVRRGNDPLLEWDGETILRPANGPEFDAALRALHEAVAVFTSGPIATIEA